MQERICSLQHCFLFHCQKCPEAGDYCCTSLNTGCPLGMSWLKHVSLLVILSIAVQLQAPHQLLLLSSNSDGLLFFPHAAEQLNGIGGSGTVPPMPAPSSPDKQQSCQASPMVAAAPHAAPCPEPSQSSKSGPAWGTKAGEISTTVAAPVTPGAAPSSNGSTKPDEEKAKKLLYCALCKVAVNSLSQLEAHNKGTSFTSK